MNFYGIYIVHTRYVILCAMYIFFLLQLSEDNKKHRQVTLFYNHYYQKMVWKTDEQENYFRAPTYLLDTIQDFLCNLGMKPHMHLVEISIFSLNHVIVRPTKIIKDLRKAST